MKQSGRLIRILGILFIVFLNCKDGVESPAVLKITLPFDSTFTTCVDSTVQINPEIFPAGNYSFSWTVDGSVVSSELNLTYQPKVTGEHLVKFSVKNGVKEAYQASFQLVVLKSGKYKVMGYLPAYKSVSPVSIKWNVLTHLCYAFVGVNADGSINDQAVQVLINNIVREGHQNGVAVLASVGGGGTRNFSTCLLNETSRKALVNNLIEFAKKSKIDGLDIDFEEFDGSSTGASDLDLQKRTALEELYKDLREKLPSDKLLTAAVSPSWLNPYWGYYNCYTSSMHQYLDLVGLMIYDQTGTYISSPCGQHSEFNAHFIPSINHWLNNQHLPAHKLLAGVPFYGYRFRSISGGLAEGIPYRDILALYPNDAPENKDNVGLIYYNGRGTILQKSNYVHSNGLGGVMIWELTQDSDEAGKDLLSVIKDVFEY